MTIQEKDPATVPTDAGHQSAVRGALDRLYRQVVDDEAQTGVITFDVSSPTERYIIFSDQHRGVRDRADDFRHSERAYNAALAYYYAMGHTLVTLGDVEELWKERPGPVINAYQHSLGLEARFYEDGRYLRFWGNHDDEWDYADSVHKHLAPIFDDTLKVHEGLRIKIVDGSEELGHLFLIHGHQGTLESDRFGQISRFFVRWFYRPFQRLTGFSPNTPATSWELREGHNRALYEWVKQQDNLLLIAGHTHRPVFESLTHPDQVLKELEELEARLAQNPDDDDLRRKVSEVSAELEWIRAQQLTKPGHEGEIIHRHKTPRYFNTGCCCFLDGKITGLELIDGQIRLIRWPDNDGKPRPCILAPDTNKPPVRLRDLLIVD
jgi:hypothetical protein